MQMDLVIDVSQLEILQEKTKTIRESRLALKHKDLPPILVEFSGSPKSGKTTNIDIISHFFKRMGFKTWASTEGASKRTPYHLRRDLVAYNTWTLSYALQELLVAFYNVDRPDLVILDRGPFDSLAWMHLLKNQGQLSDEDFATIRSFALLRIWTQRISRLYLFTCSPEVSLERELKTKLTQQHGTAMNNDMLEKLLAEYQSLQNELVDYPVLSINTTHPTDPLITAYTITQDILNLFGSQVREANDK